MKKLSFGPMVLLLMLALASVSHGGAVIDRIVAIVNGNVILQSQVEDDLCFEALSSGRPLQDLGDEDRRAALSHLIDQELLRQQIGSEIHQPSPEQVEKRIQDIRSAHPGAASNEAWHDTLARYGLNETQLQSKVTRQLALLREADLRLRPSVQIENAGIEAYYRNVFLPQLHKAGAADVPLAEVSGQIREILTQEKIDQLFNSWLESLRKESKVRTLLPEEATPSAGEATR